MSNRQVRVFQRKATSTNILFSRPNFRRGVNRRGCSHCERPDRLEVDLAAISGYGPIPWESYSQLGGQATSQHWYHIAEAVVAEPDYRNGTHGRKVLDAFDEALKTARAIIKSAREDRDLAIALEGVKVIAQIGEAQAKIAGMMPVKSKGGAQHLHIHGPGGRPSVEQAMKVLEDVRATHEPEAATADNGAAPFLPSE